MKYFIVRYLHTELDRWKEYQIPHLRFIQEHIEAGDLLISGPLEDAKEGQVEAALVFRVADREELQAQIEKDPYWTLGLVADYTVREWNPMFGLFGATGAQLGEYLDQMEHK